jgi:transcription initiation factor TFIID subunit 12
LLRQSPSLAPSTLPSPAPSMTPKDSTTGASDGPPAKKPKKLTKKAQAALDLAAAQAAQSQLQSQVNTQAHQLQNQSQSQQALSQAMAHQLQQQQQQHQQQQGPSSSSAHAPPHHIPSSLNVTPSYPEAFSAPRPTLSLGLANSPVVSTPAITRHPGLGASQVADAMRGGGTRKDGRHKDLREDSKGRTVSKRKIRELVESVDPEERLNDDVEDVSVALFLQSEYVMTNKDHDDSFYWRLRTSLSIQLRGSHVN